MAVVAQYAGGMGFAAQRDFPLLGVGAVKALLLCAGPVEGQIVLLAGDQAVDGLGQWRFLEGAVRCDEVAAGWAWAAPAASAAAADRDSRSDLMRMWTPKEK
ncbi:hypothetical protein [Duganella radicis]|uniref:hypothetical protein n=1 Tax=Duganella radicis TaxID=551988 RepID=UPI001E5774DD|nr:hypothetical protein [Duganella radicis]